MIEVNLLYFGMVRDLVQKDEETLQLEEASDVRHLKERLFYIYQELRDYDNFAVAVNETYVQEEEVLQNGDLIALIPPVSGG